MNCLICNEETSYFFHKDFNQYGLKRVDYHKCSNCGLVASKTHYLMDEHAWGELNHICHSEYQGSDDNWHDPRWLERLQAQAKILKDCCDLNLLSVSGKWLDYACGDGKLSELLKGQQALLKYDKFMSKSDGFINDNEINSQHFDFVITTSVFEDFTKRKDFDFVQSLVSDEGVMGLHTLVREDVPNDPKWFYLSPTHCSFHTNKSMSLLLEQWGYIESIYSVDARLWLFFKPNLKNVEQIIEIANKRIDKPKYIYNKGFVDYWK